MNLADILLSYFSFCKALYHIEKAEYISMHVRICFKKMLNYSLFP